MAYLLDSNAIIHTLNQLDGQVATAAMRHPDEDVVTSSVVMHELYFGAYKSAKLERNLAMLETIRFPVLEFDRQDAQEAGRIRVLLRAVGTPIGPYDVLIAGQALRRGLTLVTANFREFERVPGLLCEDWSR
jgi:tRNA(fMet)-specific endonuclease VapC